MPYVSDAERGFFHTDTAKKKGITPSMVKEYDQASKGKVLPDKVVQRTAKAATKKTKINKDKTSSGLDMRHAAKSVVGASKNAPNMQFGPRQNFNMPR